MLNFESIMQLSGFDKMQIEMKNISIQGNDAPVCEPGLFLKTWRGGGPRLAILLSTYKVTSQTPARVRKNFSGDVRQVGNGTFKEFWV